MNAAYDVLRDLAGIVLAHESRERVLDRVTTAAKRGIRPADEVSMTLIEGDRAYTAAHTGALALDADELQYANGYGPCMDAARAGMVFNIPDMAVEDRWPDYSPAAAAAGVGSSLSVPLPVQVELIGALNIYSRAPGAFDDPAILPLAEEIASLAAVAVQNATAYENATQLAHQMSEAMSSRAVIEQAKGVLMAQRHCSADEAFAILNKASSQSNRKLRVIAQEIVDAVTGTGS